MAEPIESLLPTAYDDATSLLGDIISQRSFELFAGISSSDTTIPVLGNLGDIEVPVYVMFPGSSPEVIFCETKAGDNKSFTNCIRGARGSDAATHDAGDVFLMVLSGQHANMLREAVIAGQIYRGLVGTDAGKAGTPAVNEQYFASDTDKFYVAVTGSAWSFFGPRPDHADLDDLTGEDDHTQYHNDARAVIWHDGLTGGHVIGGDTHDHGLASVDGAGRVQAGVAAGRSATPNYEREIYYETDTDLLYIAKGTGGPSDWVKIVGAPAGTIAPFLEADLTSLYSSACPPGWSRFTALDARFAKGANTDEVAGFSTGGAATHTHDYTDVLSHNHTVPATNPGASTAIGHKHDIKEGGGSGDKGLLLSGGGRPGGTQTTTHENHSHTFDIPAHDTENTKRTSDDASGVATGTTASVGSEPPYQEIVFCEKD